MSTIDARMLIVQCNATWPPPHYKEVPDRKMKPVGKILHLFGNEKAFMPKFSAMRNA